MFHNSISCSSCTDVTLRWLRRIDDTTILFYLIDQYCDDSAILKILPYWWVCRIHMETTLQYWGFCRIVLHHAFSAVLSFTSVSDTSLALRNFLSLWTAVHFSFHIHYSNEWVERIIRWNGPKQTASVLTKQDPNMIQLFQQEKRKQIKRECFALLF